MKYNPAYDKAAEMYNSGLSIETVAILFGVTRQAMYKILKRRGVIFRKQNQWNQIDSNSDKKVHKAVSTAIAKGLIIRKACEVCGARQTDAHHDDYNKPLVIRWLCRKHHFEWHSKFRAVSRIK